MGRKGFAISLWSWEVGHRPALPFIGLWLWPGAAVQSCVGSVGFALKAVAGIQQSCLRHQATTGCVDHVARAALPADLGLRSMLTLDACFPADMR